MKEQVGKITMNKDNEGVCVAKSPQKNQIMIFLENTSFHIKNYF